MVGLAAWTGGLHGVAAGTAGALVRGMAGVGRSSCAGAASSAPGISISGGPRSSFSAGALLDEAGRCTLERGRAWQVAQPLDAEAMHRAAQALVGNHDFTTFRSVQCQSASPVKTLDLLTVERVGEEVHIRAAARSFLHHQVRGMVGCLALVGMGRWREEQVGEALAARNRAALGLNAPPHGLYFVRATYP